MLGLIKFGQNRPSMMAAIVDSMVVFVAVAYLTEYNSF